MVLVVPQLASYLSGKGVRRTVEGVDANVAIVVSAEQMPSRETRDHDGGGEHRAPAYAAGR